MKVMTAREARWCAVVLVPLATACEANVGHEASSVVEVRLGTIEFYDKPVSIQTRDDVATGDTVSVVVTTYGDGCVTMGPTEVASTGDLRVEITPWDSVARPGPAALCPAVLKELSHEAVIILHRPGLASIVVRGSRQPGGAQISVTKTLRVR